MLFPFSISFGHFSISPRAEALIDLAIAIVVAVAYAPVLWIASECALSLLPTRSRRLRNAVAPKLTVLIPAHDEELGIAATVRAIRSELTSADRVLVVADNCRDQTADLARLAGAEVVERHSPERRGKGYALQYGLEHLSSDPPEVVVFIDADTRPSPAAIDLVARTASVLGRPVQGGYAMTAPPGSSVKNSVSAFAVFVKNIARPRGLQRVGLPCLLTGSGFAVPWSLLQRVSIPLDHVVEDMRYAVDLALVGKAPVPCVEARFVAPLPSNEDAFTTQRTRWEHGHLSVIGAEAPRMVVGLLRSNPTSIFALLMEVITPPLLLLLTGAVSGIITMTVLALLTGLESLWIAAFSSTAALGFLFLSLFMLWARDGREYLKPNALVGIPHYMASKAPIYLRFLKRRETTWVRTSRD